MKAPRYNLVGSRKKPNCGAWEKKRSIKFRIVAGDGSSESGCNGLTSVNGDIDDEVDPADGGLEVEIVDVTEKGDEGL